MRTLPGLSPEERRWLARKARLLGGLEPTLRLLLRNGRLCEAALQEWETQEQEGGAQAANAARRDTAIERVARPHRARRGINRRRRAHRC